MDYQELEDVVCELRMFLGLKGIEKVKCEVFDVSRSELEIAFNTNPEQSRDILFLSQLTAAVTGRNVNQTHEYVSCGI